MDLFRGEELAATPQHFFMISFPARIHAKPRLVCRLTCIVKMKSPSPRHKASLAINNSITEMQKATPAAPGGTLQSRKVGGLGVHFVKALMDDVAYMRAGRHNVVRITKKLLQGAGDGHS